MTDPNPGTVHTMEEEMRAAGQGVFEGKSARAPKNKTRVVAPENKAGSFDHDGDGHPGSSKAGAQSTRSRGKAKAK